MYACAFNGAARVVCLSPNERKPSEYGVPLITNHTVWMYCDIFLRRSKPYRRIKLMIVGAGNKGKTSLLLNLTKKGRMVLFKEVELGYNSRPLATVGVDLGDWEYAPRGRNKVTFMTWDFGGQVSA